MEVIEDREDARRVGQARPVVEAQRDDWPGARSVLDRTRAGSSAANQAVSLDRSDGASSRGDWRRARGTATTAGEADRGERYGECSYRPPASSFRRPRHLDKTMPQGRSVQCIASQAAPNLEDDCGLQSLTSGLAQGSRCSRPRQRGDENYVLIVLEVTPAQDSSAAPLNHDTVVYPRTSRSTEYMTVGVALSVTHRPAAARASSVPVDVSPFADAVASLARSKNHATFPARLSIREHNEGPNRPQSTLSPSLRLAQRGDPRVSQFRAFTR